MDEDSLNFVEVPKPICPWVDTPGRSEGVGLLFRIGSYVGALNGERGYWVLVSWGLKALGLFLGTQDAQIHCEY